MQQFFFGGGVVEMLNRDTKDTTKAFTDRAGGK